LEEYIFAYDIGHDRPERRQVLRLPNTWPGRASGHGRGIATL
jgi:hypothetical protein